MQTQPLKYRNPLLLRCMSRSRRPTDSTSTPEARVREDDACVWVIERFGPPHYSKVNPTDRHQPSKIHDKDGQVHDSHLHPCPVKK